MFYKEWLYHQALTSKLSCRDMKGLIGRKIGMTQIFSDKGHSIPVSIIHLPPNHVCEIKTEKKHGYNSYKLAIEPTEKLNKPQKGYFTKNNLKSYKTIREIRNMRLENTSVGDNLGVDIFEPGDIVSVQGVSKGKGFAGSIKRHNQSRGPMSHGSRYHRRPGSMGPISPNRVMPGKKLPGQMGGGTATSENLVVIMIDKNYEVLMVKGAIPGPNKSLVKIISSKKKTKAKEIIKIVNLKEIELKNQLLEEAKKWGASVTTDSSVEEMEAIINEVRSQRERENTKSNSDASESKEKNDESIENEDKESSKQ